MNIMVFDTETISVNKPYCYNIGYIIYNTDGGQVLCKRDFVVEQVWNNSGLLFHTCSTTKSRLHKTRPPSVL